jgi:hypothetical protein
MRNVYKYRNLPLHFESINNGQFQVTPLTEYLRLGGCDDYVKNLRYIEMPLYFRWDVDQWIPRQPLVHILFNIIFLL